METHPSDTLTRTRSRSEESTRRQRETCGARAQVQLENILFLLSWHTPVWEIPARVGIPSMRALERFLYRHGREDIIAEMRRRDPLTLNYARPDRRRRRVGSPA